MATDIIRIILSLARLTREVKETVNNMLIGEIERVLKQVMLEQLYLISFKQPSLDEMLEKVEELTGNRRLVELLRRLSE